MHISPRGRRASGPDNSRHSCAMAGRYFLLHMCGLILYRIFLYLTCSVGSFPAFDVDALYSTVAQALCSDQQLYIGEDASLKNLIEELGTRMRSQFSKLAFLLIQVLNLAYLFEFTEYFSDVRLKPTRPHDMRGEKFTSGTAKSPSKIFANPILSKVSVPTSYENIPLNPIKNALCREKRGFVVCWN
jgi:hypothetical protein